MSDKVNAAGGIFVFFGDVGEPLIGLQQREDTGEWAATGGIIEDYDNVGGLLYHVHHIERFCLWRFD